MKGRRCDCAGTAGRTECPGQRGRATPFRVDGHYQESSLPLYLCFDFALSSQGVGVRLAVAAPRPVVMLSGCISESPGGPALHGGLQHALCGRGAWVSSLFSLTSDGERVGELFVTW